MWIIGFSLISGFPFARATASQPDGASLGVFHLRRQNPLPGRAHELEPARDDGNRDDHHEHLGTRPLCDGRRARPLAALRGLVVRSRGHGWRIGRALHGDDIHQASGPGPHAHTDANGAHLVHRAGGPSIGRDAHPPGDAGDAGHHGGRGPAPIRQESHRKTGSAHLLPHPRGGGRLCEHLAHRAQIRLRPHSIG